MLWIKSLHIVFIASWFAVLFYLPRIFVNLAQVEVGNSAEYQRLVGMAERLSRFGNILLIPALGFGAWLWLGYGIGAGQPWFYAKLVVVLLAVGYQHACASILRKFKNNANQRSHTWFRWFNEVPVLLMLIAVVLVVVKPQV
jgi:protoporphyrinogen IX oxidase